MSQTRYCFASLEDPRDSRGKEHLLLDIGISGAEGWEDKNTAEPSRSGSRLRCPMGLPLLTPSIPEQMQSCFVSWVNAISQLLEAAASFLRQKCRHCCHPYGECLGKCEPPSARATQSGR